jgi:Calx-beta domain/PQQ-like domain
MRRGLRLPSLVLVVAVSLAGAASAQERGLEPILGQPAVPVRTGTVDMEKAVEWELVLGPAFRDEITKRAPKPPRRLPELPMPKGFEPPAPFETAIAPPELETPQSPLPLPATSFTSLGDVNTAIPPDTHGAVGPTKLMTTLNTQVHVQRRDGGVASGPTSLGNFWAGIATAGVFDPRVYYDPDPAYGGRWIWVAVQGAEAASSGVLVAASSDSEPVRGAGALFDADGTNASWADYPTVGFNGRWVVVQVNLFGMNPYPFLGSKIYVFPKSDFYSGVFSSVVQFTLGSTSCGGSSCGGTQVPALTYDFAQSDIYLVQRWNSGAGALRLYSITDPGTGLQVNPLGFVIGPPWADSEPSGMAADFAPQGPGCGTSKIQTNDSRIQNVVWRNGSLWTTQTVFLSTPSRASVQWWQIQPSPASVIQRGLIDDAAGTTFYAFPSIAVNKFDDVLVGFSSFAPNEFASGRYAYRLAGDPAGTMQKPVLLKAGEACYYKDYGTTKNRWGDYSATAVDPLDDTTMWTLQEYAETRINPADRWGTWWGAVGPPAISIADASVAEGNSGTTPLTFTLSLSGQTSETVTVQWATENDTATDVDNDYVPAGGTVTFPPLATTATIQVLVNGDTKYEPNERFLVNLSSPQYAIISDAQAVGTILNDDPAPQMSISDVQVVEGNAGFTNADFTVTLSYPSAAPVSAAWATHTGTASAGDFVMASGTVDFAAGEVTKTVSVLVVGDTVYESNEAFTVELSGVSGAALLKPIGTCVILNDDLPTPYPAVGSLGVVSDGGPSAGRNRLEWVNPAVAAQGVRIKFATGPTSCTPPGSPGAEPWGSPPAGTFDVAYSGAGTVQSYEHGSLPTPYEQYCYSVWVSYAGIWSSATTATGRPFDATGKVKWKYFTGATSVAMPSVGEDAILAPSNADSSLHSMARGSGGGTWPANWPPVILGSLAQARSPVVPLTGGSRAFVSTQDGRIHAIDTATRAEAWVTLLPDGAATAAPAVIFKPYGAYDYVLVGTSAGVAGVSDHFYALDPYSGAVIDAFPGPNDGAVKVGAVLGMATVDYDTSRVFFASRRADGTGPSLWCLELGPSSDALRLGWSRDLGADVDASPVLRGGRLYVGDGNTNNWAVWSIPAANGLGGYSLRVGNSAIKGFLFPDRSGSDLFAATSSEVVALTDNGTALSQKAWSPRTLADPSIVLLKPGTTSLYVGVSSYSGNASLLKIDTVTGAMTAVALEPSSLIVGPPSLDIGLNPNMIYVGSVSGVFYAVEASF